MPYEEIVKNRRDYKADPIVTIGKGGIYLNSFLMRDEHFQGIRWVKLMYNREKNYLALKPLKNGEKNAFSLNFSSKKSRSTGVVAARSAIKLLKLDASKREQYTATWNEKEKILEIEL